MNCHLYGSDFKWLLLLSNYDHSDNTHVASQTNFCKHMNLNRSNLHCIYNNFYTIFSKITLICVLFRDSTDIV